MREVTLKQVAAWIGGTVEPRFENIVISSFCHDSREAVTGTLFFALVANADGHNFIESALNNGAVAAVISHPIDIPCPVIMVADTHQALMDAAREYKRSLNCKTVAITGSVGKTTTRTMITALLAKKYRTSCTYKNYNNDIGLPITIGKSAPDCEMLVLEMGMNHFGEISKLTQIGRPDIVVITNIGSMHIENLGSREGILQAKLEILEGLSEDGVAIFNGDEPLLWNLHDQKRCNTEYFGIDREECELRATDVQLCGSSSHFRIIGKGYDFPVELAIPGLHNVYNAVSAIHVALLCDVTVADIQETLKGFVNTSQRQQTFFWNNLTIIDDTYNAGPESMEAALQVLGDTTGTTDRFRRIAVLGDMLELGNHASGEHHRIGRIAAYKADIILTYGKDSAKIVRGAITGGIGQRNAMNFDTHEALVNTLKNRVRPGDVLLFKGSHGMRMDLVLKAFMEQSDS